MSPYRFLRFRVSLVFPPRTCVVLPLLLRVVDLRAFAIFSFSLLACVPTLEISRKMDRAREGHFVGWISLLAGPSFADNSFFDLNRLTRTCSRKAFSLAARASWLSALTKGFAL
jgi:hypothetical protein